MRVWVIHDSEPIPSDPGGRRPMRAGMLAAALAQRGHETVWFTSSFDHYQKRQRPGGDQTIAASPNLTIEVLDGPGYARNVSLKRIAHIRHFARRWRAYADTCAARPDILLPDLPTTEEAKAAVAFGRENGIPSILSIRDLWPDFFLDYLPAPLRPLAKPFVGALDAQTRYACANATALVGISDDYLAWGRAKGGRPQSELDRVFPLGYAAQPRPDDAALVRFRDRLGLGTKTIVSFVGSWGRTYDLELVRLAAAQLTHRTDIVFAVTGDKDTQPALRDAFARLPNVVLTGWFSADDIALLVSASAIGLLPYQPGAPQGLPNKVFEYMAYGAYQLATLEGEIGRFYADTEAGRAVGRDFAASIPAALPVALDPIKRAERIALFERRYSADTVYGAMVDHIEHVAGLSTRPPGSAPRS